MTLEEVKQELRESLKKIEEEKEKLTKRLNEIREIQNRELKPYDWKNREGYFINSSGSVCYNSRLYFNELFYFTDEPKAKSFARELKFLKLLLELKESLEDDKVFETGVANYHIIYDVRDSAFIRCSYEFLRDPCVVYFHEHNIGRVIRYLKNNVNAKDYLS